jgi:hypothetical protein
VSQRDCITSLEVPESNVIQSHLYIHVAPDINFFLTHSLILCLSLKFLCLGFKLIQIIIFILNTLRGSSMLIQNTLRATQLEAYWLTQGEANLIG